jgi:dethiobiotin synthetase
LTAVDVLRARGVELAAVVISESQEQPVAATETAATLARFLGATPIAVLPRTARTPLLPLLASHLR